MEINISHDLLIIKIKQLGAGFYMRKTSSYITISIMFLTIATVCFGNDKVYTSKDVSLKNGILYDTKIDTPVNGIVNDYYESGALKHEAPYKDGKENGLAACRTYSSEIMA